MSGCRGPRTERPAAPHTGRVRKSAVRGAAAAPESKGRGPRCRAAAVSASPALPEEARSGAERQEAAPLKPVSAAPDQTARPPREAGPEGRRGGALRHARLRPGQSEAASRGRARAFLERARVGGGELPGIPRVPTVHLSRTPGAAAGGRGDLAWG